MRAEIVALHRRLRTTMIYVTHDQVEAMTMADRIVVLRGGRIEQTGAPLALYNAPAQPLRRRVHRLAADELRAGETRGRERRRRARRAAGRRHRSRRSDRECLRNRIVADARHPARAPARSRTPRNRRSGWWSSRSSASVATVSSTAGCTAAIRALPWHCPARPRSRSAKLLPRSRNRGTAICSATTASRSIGSSGTRHEAASPRDLARGVRELRHAVTRARMAMPRRVARGRARPDHADSPGRLPRATHLGDRAGARRSLGRSIAR